MEKVFNKLVRDKIPEIIENNGEKSIIKFLNDEDYKVELEKKLIEEYQEMLNSKTNEEKTEELADILEVVFSLAEFINVDEKKLMNIMKNKREARGRFKNRIFLEKTID